MDVSIVSAPFTTDSFVLPAEAPATDFFIELFSDQLREEDIKLICSSGRCSSCSSCGSCGGCGSCGSCYC